MATVRRWEPPAVAFGYASRFSLSTRHWTPRPDSTRKALLEAIAGRVLEKAELVVTYERPPA